MMENIPDMNRWARWQLEREKAYREMRRKHGNQLRAFLAHKRRGKGK